MYTLLQVNNKEKKKKKEKALIGFLTRRTPIGMQQI